MKKILIVDPYFGCIFLQIILLGGGLLKSHVLPQERLLGNHNGGWRMQ